MENSPKSPIAAIPDLKDKEVVPPGATAPASPAAHVHADPPIGLRTVAMFEFGKGILFLLFGLGALSFVHQDVANAADNILKHLHLDPAWHLSKYIVRKMSDFTPSQIRFSGIIALILSAGRAVEGYCLWHERPWAEWFAVISSSCYMPYEIYRFFRHPDAVIVIIFLVNLAIVIYLSYLLVGNHKKRALEKKAQPH